MVFVKAKGKDTIDGCYGLCLLFQCTSLCEIPQNDQQPLASSLILPPPKKTGSQFNDPRCFHPFFSFTTTTKLHFLHLPSSKSPNPPGSPAFPTHYASNSYTSDGRMPRDFEGPKPGGFASAKVIFLGLHHVTAPEKTEHNIESLKMMVWKMTSFCAEL